MTIAQYLASFSNDDFAAVYGEILKMARERGFQGFGGNCAQAAYAINSVIFDGAGTYGAAFNEFFLDHGQHHGHVFVIAREAFWDADGYPKFEDDVDTWGSLDPEDPDYQQAAARFGAKLADIAERCDLFEFEPGEFDPMMFPGEDRRQEFVELLRENAQIAINRRGIQI